MPLERVKVVESIEISPDRVISVRSRVEILDSDSGEVVARGDAERLTFEPGDAIADRETVRGLDEFGRAALADVAGALWTADTVKRYRETIARRGAVASAIAGGGR